MNIRRFKIVCKGKNSPVGIRIAVTADLHHRPWEEAAEQLAHMGVFSALSDKLSDLSAISAAYTTLLRAVYIARAT